MNELDFLYGCHSGVQKAIRRGDLNLAKTCFDAMWPDSKHRNWLKWRMTVLVEEDVWQMIGEYAQFLKEVKLLKGDEKAEEQAWRRFLYELVVVPKSKDTEGLLYVAMKTKAKEDEHEELSSIRYWLNIDGDPAHVVEDLYDELKKKRRLSSYENDALKVLKSRVYQGGMMGDRQACLACMILVVSRRLNEKEIKKQIGWGVKRWNRLSKHKKPRTINLPWYVFDMHTAIGKFALSVFMKKSKYPGLDRGKFDDIWFDLESAWIPEDLYREAKYTTGKVSATESMWWPILMDIELRFGGYKPEGVRHLWKSEMKKKIKNIVLWCAQKRSEK